MKKPFGKIFKLISYVAKNHYWFNLALGLGGCTTAGVFLHNGSPIGIAILLLSSFILIFNAIGSPSERFSTLVEYGSLKILEKHMLRAQKSLLPFKGTILNFEQKEANNISHLFIEQMFFIMNGPKKLAKFIKPSQEKEEWLGFYETFKTHQKTLTSLYLNHFKDSIVFAQVIINVSYLKQYSTSLDFYQALFLHLWPIHQQKFTKKELRYLEANLDINQISDGSLFYREDIFSALSLKLQEKILLLAGSAINDKKNYETLVHLHQTHQEFKESEKIDLNLNTQEIVNQDTHLNQHLVVNSDTQNIVDTFEKRFTFLYEKESDTLKSITDLVLAREKIAYILTHSDKKAFYIEATLFLDNEVNKLIQGFNDETLILMKMKVGEHPQLDTHKKLILDSIQVRTKTVQEKMLQISQQLNDAMEEELLSTKYINEAVLHAKI